MLGIERLDKAIAKAKEDVRSNANMVSFIERNLTERELVERRITELTESERSLEKPVAEAAEALTATRANLEKITEEYKVSQSRRSEWSELKVRIEAQRKSIDSLGEQKARLSSEKESLEKNRQELSSLKAPLEEYARVRKELDSLTETKGKIGQKAQLQKRVIELSRELEQTVAKRAEADASLRGLKGQREAIPEDIAKYVDEAQEKVDSAIREYSALTSEKEALEKEREKLNRQLASISELGPDSICDRCRRPFGEEFDDIRGHFAGDLSQLESGIAERTALLTERKENGDRLRNELNDLKKGLQKSQELRLKIESAEKELAGLTDKVAQLERQSVDVRNELKEFDGLTFEQSKYDSLTQRMKELERIRERAGNLQGSLGRLPEVANQLQEVEASIKSGVAELNDREKAIQKLGFSEEQHEKLSESLSSAQKGLEDARQKQTSLTKELELVKKELDDKRDQLAGFERQAKELEQFRSAHYHGEKLSTLFGDFRKQLIAGIRPALGEISSRLYAEMTGGKYSMVELDEKYNLQVWDGGAYYGVDRFSGGEKDLANLCLRLAISLALTEAAGLSRSFVILDEVFGSQDNERKELILKSLGSLKQRFPQILLITHIDDIKDGVEEVMEVIPTNAGWSEIRINGA
jgi:exonuclease SbcC